MKKIAISICLSLSLLCFNSAFAKAASADASVPAVTVKIVNSDGRAIGTAQLVQQTHGVHIYLQAEKLPPGTHGIHFHTIGKCETPDFKSAGEHFNPQGKQHGFHNPKGFHAGDLLNIQVGADGRVKAELVSQTVTLVKGKSNSLLKPGGTSLMIHEKADDYVTDPAGNSGSRIACGSIQ
ncbi:superoxide dismutase family protein [Paenibacillus sp. sptzw28]|uniref:superoxide dismutase family protein n=1 Tax=Paenibacillus sp. sptzw28 TaxID=715179 RepID=UPI001C6E330C|nr:superoxide dismutase family protein [Paenibacillus sp. sptzw28]QYR19435.1 superoxide dismutase family protein [Paenibacillus sp. sptzw28]